MESALLTHGLRSIRDDRMYEVWPDILDQIVWVDKGRVVIGDMEQFLPFRDRAKEAIRIDCYGLDRAISEGLSGALTASGTMEVCCRLGFSTAVTCGMGGIGDLVGEELCPDLPALEKIPVGLIATSPKDMLRIPETLDWLRAHGVKVVGYKSERCTGYIFNSTEVKLDGCYKGEHLGPHMLLLNQIPRERRVQDLSLMRAGIRAGQRAEREGSYYHPAFNGEIDRLTEGASSEIQLASLIENGLLAERICRC